MPGATAAGIPRVQPAAGQPAQAGAAGDQKDRLGSDQEEFDVGPIPIHQTRRYAMMPRVDRGRSRTA